MSALGARAPAIFPNKNPSRVFATSPLSMVAFDRHSRLRPQILCGQARVDLNPALFAIHCTAPRPLHCTTSTALYHAHCTAPRPLHCTTPTALRHAHCTTTPTALHHCTALVHCHRAHPPVTYSHASAVQQRRGCVWLSNILTMSRCMVKIATFSRPIMPAQVPPVRAPLLTSPPPQTRTAAGAVARR
jgi:hypothetical protein